MKRIQKTGRLRPFSIAVCALALLSACASDRGEKGVEAPFPNLAEVPGRPESGSTPQERAELKAQLQHRRDQINDVAASLLRGGTEPVPVALESQVPEAPRSRRAQVAPPPLPEGLPVPPERPEFLSDTETPNAAGAPSKSDEEEVETSQDPMIEAPEEEQMPPARAAGSSESGDESASDEDDEEADG